MTKSKNGEKCRLSWILVTLLLCNIGESNENPFSQIAILNPQKHRLDPKNQRFSLLQ